MVIPEMMTGRWSLMGNGAGLILSVVGVIALVLWVVSILSPKKIDRLERKEATKRNE